MIRKIKEGMVSDTVTENPTMKDRFDVIYKETHSAGLEKRI